MRCTERTGAGSEEVDGKVEALGMAGLAADGAEAL